MLENVKQLVIVKLNSQSFPSYRHYIVIHMGIILLVRHLSMQKHLVKDKKVPKKCENRQSEYEFT